MRELRHRIVGQDFKPGFVVGRWGRAVALGILAGAVLAAAPRVSWGADDAAAATAQPAATQPAVASNDVVIPIDKFDVVFQLGSRGGNVEEMKSVKLSGPALRGLGHRADDGTWEVTAEELEDVQVELGVVDGKYVDPAIAAEKVKVRLRDLSYPTPAPFHVSALESIAGQIGGALNDAGLIAVAPYYDGTELSKTGGTGAAAVYGDARPAGQKGWKLTVLLGTVREVRTIASGDRVPTERRLNAVEHEKIRFGSPVWPAEKSDQAGRKDVVRKDELDDYVYRLNRYPGRRVDVALSQSEQPGGTVLDYLVSEAKPWTLYAQASNTGTKNTNEWRERIGFVDNELTNHDDILSLDYVTAGFEDVSQAVIGSYEVPVPTFDRLRAKVYGSYSAYTASDVGLSGNNFDGHETTAGGELIANVWQKRDLFVDLYGGFRYENIATNNTTGTVTRGEADVYQPYIGARVERVTDTTSFSTSMTLSEGIMDANDVAALGREGAAETWTTLEMASNYSFYIEPLIFPGRFSGKADQQSASQAKLANEIALSARGQTSFGERLIPQHEEVAGGLYTVRGYPESVTAGDEVIIGSAEYRFHIPRALDLQPTPSTVFGKPFRWQPDRVLGRPDWDLILKGFVDAAQVVNDHRIVGVENDQSLVGVGVGLELQLKQNFNFQVYWGVALTDVPGEVDAGDNRFHFVFTALY